MKKSLLIAVLIAMALAACSSQPAPDGITLPTYACTQTPTGEAKAKVVQECDSGKCYSTHPVTYTYYAVKIACEHTEWRTK
jgi:hypothetical protein